MRRGCLVDERETLAASILKSVRIVPIATRSVQVIRRMSLNGEDQDMSMILAIQGKKDLYIKALGPVGEKFESLMAQTLQVWGLSLAGFISCGFNMIDSGKDEVNGMHVLMLLRSRTSVLDGEAEGAESRGRPVLTLIRKEGL